ncbi:MAG: hypothetical protein QOG23_4451 [Blastocatellia bacterium]|jgi:hypothetical protein|nr:hypothetical protein [Blastocatellia bacterium]
MRSSYRIAIGFLFGCVLAVCAFGLAGAGHGTYTPMAANAPMLAVILEIGVAVALFGTPLLWAGYFLMLPQIPARVPRLLAVAAVALVHLGTAVWMSSRDEYFGRVFDRYPSFMLFYFVVLIVGVLILGVMSAARAPELKLS